MPGEVPQHLDCQMQDKRDLFWTFNVITTCRRRRSGPEKKLICIPDFKSKLVGISAGFALTSRSNVKLVWV